MSTPPGFADESVGPLGTAMTRRRLDAELVRRRLVATRAEAQQAIVEGRVTVGGAPAGKAATLVAADQPLAVQPVAVAYASRGGHKLAGALAALGVDPAGRQCLDAGASTGGFTDVLIRRGAARVVAVDVGYGQLAWHLRTDARVVVLDRTNVRRLVPDDVPPPAPDLVVADLSFISLTLVVAALRAVASQEADHLLMVKPQFEAGAGRVGKGGVVRDAAVWTDALKRVTAAAAAFDLGLVAATPSPLPGPAGNVEFFLHLRAGATGDSTAILPLAVESGRNLQP